MHSAACSTVAAAAIPCAQTKENLTLRASSFGSKCEVPQTFIDKVARCGVVDHILNFANFRNNKELKKSDGAKRARLTGGPQLKQKLKVFQLPDCDC